VPLDQSWANGALSWGATFLNDEKTWNSPHNFYNKIIVIRGLIEFLEDLGYWWQAKTLSHHLNRYLSKISKFTAEDPPTLLTRGGASS
jgi:hypothetical protein